MRVTIAVVRLILKVSKTLSDGTHPIMLYCAFRGKKYVSTGYSCHVQHWDKQHEMVKRGCPNYMMINDAIHRLKSDAISRRNDFERRRVPYTPEMVLEPCEVLSAPSLDISSLYERYAAERGLKMHTRSGWKYGMNLLWEFSGRKRMNVNELTLSFNRRFHSWLVKVKGLSENSCVETLAHFSALQRYAVDRDLMSEKEYGFRGWSFRRVDSKRQLEYVHPRSLSFIKRYMFDLLCEHDDFSYSYRLDMLERVRSRYTKEFALWYWCCGCFLFQGLSPVDLCLLRKDMFKSFVLEGRSYYLIVTKREKTSKVVRIVIPREDLFLEAMMNVSFWREEGDGWFMPVLDGCDDDEEKRKTRIRNNASWIAPKLREMFSEINKVIVDYNVSSGENVPLIDDGLVMYSYRHTFSMKYLEGGGSILGLGTRLGHGKDLKSLASYVAMLRREDDLVSTYVEI